jgi:hexosaminidase
VTASIDWGDGTTTPGTVTGKAATPSAVNSLYAIGGDHLYTMSGTHHATVTVTAPGAAPATVRITLT